MRTQRRVMPTLRCKVVDKDGERCVSIIEVTGPILEGAGFTCKNHPRSVQVRANGRSYDPVRDEIDKDLHFQDVAFDPELGGDIDPITEDGINHGRRKNPISY